MSDPYKYASDYHPPCSARYGRMNEPDPLVCTKIPGHRGLHSNRKAGIIWGDEDAYPTPCPWKGCAAPMGQEFDEVHFCPGGEADRRYGADHE